MRSRTCSWTNTLTKLGFMRKRGRNLAKVGVTRPMRVEGLEDRRMLTTPAVGSFERTEAVFGPDPDMYTFASVQAEANGQPAGDFNDDATDHAFSWSPAVNSISYMGATGSGNSQALGEILTPIGESTPVPSASLASIGLASAFQSQGYGLGRAIGGGIVRSRFVYDDPDPLVPKAFYAAVYAADFGLGIAGGNNSRWDYTASTPFNFVNISLNGGTLVEVQYTTVGVGAEVCIGQDIPNGVNYVATITIAGQQPFQINAGGLNHYINAIAPDINSGDIVTITASYDPSWENNASAVHSDICGGSSSANYAFSTSLMGYGFAFDAANPPTFPPSSGGGVAGGGGDGDQIFLGGTAPGDMNGDGVIDTDDTEDWIDVLKDLNADSAVLGAVSRPLIVTTAEDIDDGDYSFHDLSLREAIKLAETAAYPGQDTIVFAKWVDEIVLGSQLTIAADNDVHIVGPGADKLTISGNNSTRVFNIASGADVTMNGLTITGGKTTGTNHGAGIYNLGNLTLNHVNVVDNHALNSGRGGGLYSAGGNVTIVASTFDNNTAHSGGGARIALGGTDTASIADSTISNNEAKSSSGGGLLLEGTGNALITNSTVSSNEAEAYGGGIRVNNDVDLELINSTVYGNYANTREGGLSSQGTSVSFVHNSILAGNHDGDSGSSQDDATGTIDASSSYNLVGVTNKNFFTNESNNNDWIGSASPGLAPLGHYGGSTMTHALFNGSPAIDKASTTKATAYGLLLDQRGKSRSVDTNAANGADGFTDIGAYETGNEYNLLVTIPNDESNSGYEADDLSLRETLELTDLLAGRATITFAENVTDIQVGPQLVIAKDLTIAGPGADILTLDGGGQDRVFFIEDTVYDAVISGLTITGGNAWYDNTPSGVGGGIYNEGVLTLDAVTIDDNYAYIAGGGIYTTIGNSTSGLTVKNSTISNNSADQDGGGIYIVGFGSHGIQILNSTITANSAKYSGSGITDNSGYAKIVNSTITLNSSSSTAAGISTIGGTWLANTIVTANTNSGGQSNLGGNFSSTSRHNFIGYDANTTNGINNGSNGNQVGESTPIDARLSALDYWGGTTKTHKPLLSPHSPVLEAGDNAVAEAFGLLFDQRGFDRFTYDIVEIGAFELEEAV